MKLNSNVSTLSKKIKELSFLNELLNSNTIYLGSTQVKFKDSSTKVKEGILKDLNFWIKVQQLLKRLCIEDDIDLSNMTQTDYNNLKMLVDSIIDEKIIEHIGPIDVISHTDIGKYRILLFTEEVGENRYKISNFFETESKMVYAYEKQDNKKYMTSMFTAAFIMNDFYKFSNVNYNLLISSYENMVDKNPDIFERANWDMLLALNAYDKQKEKSEKLYDGILKLNNWLLEKDKKNKNIHIINKFQIVKRKRDLEKSEKKELSSLLDSSNLQLMTKLGINILLENKGTAENQFEKLSKAEQNFFKLQPIYYLMIR